MELLLRRLAGNDELQVALSRYVVIGECLRNAPGQSVTRGFQARVCAAVAAEGTRKGVDRLRSLGHWLRPVGGLAIAAAVATVAILGLQRTQQLDPAGATPVVASTSVPAAAIGGPAIDEPLAYTVPAPSTGAPVIPAGRLDELLSWRTVSTHLRSGGVMCFQASLPKTRPRWTNLQLCRPKTTTTRTRPDSCAAAPGHRLLSAARTERCLGG